MSSMRDLDSTKYDVYARLNVMTQRLSDFVTIAIHAFVPWALVLFVLSLMVNLPRGAFVFFHYVIDVLLFGLVFHFYYQAHPHTHAFHTTIFALLSLFLFEAIFWTFFASGADKFLNFVDWIFPAFLIATTIYAIGKRGS